MWGAILKTGIKNAPPTIIITHLNGGFFMGKKKNKIAKLTEEQYVAYIAGLKNTAAIVNPDGSVLVPDGLKKEKDPEK